MDMDSFTNIWNKYPRWYRLLILIHESGEYLCNDILYKMGVKDVTDGVEIYSRLKPYGKEIKELGTTLEKIFLPDDEVIDIKKMDISLKTHIIQIMDKHQDYPLIAKLRQKRIELLYMREDERNMTEQQFSTYWNEILELLTSLHYNIYLINDLKTEDNLVQKYKQTFKDVNQKLEGITELINLFFYLFYLFYHFLRSTKLI